MFFILFIVNLFAAVFGRYNIFQNQTIELEYGEIAFFETPGFPLLHNSSEVFLYYSTFFTSNISSNGTRCVFILQGLSYYPAPYKNINDVFIFDTSSFLLETFHYIPFYYQALQGYIYFEEADDRCPFESMARETPFKFDDETQIILIQSVYKNKTNFGDVSVTPSRIRDCLWRFIAPQGYGLKIFIQNYNVSSTTRFRISNTTDVLMNERSVKINEAYYYYDQYQHFQIGLSKDDNFLTTEIEFSAYVSVVKQDIKKTKGSCVVTFGNGSFYWSSNNNLALGYQNNVFCDYEVVVKSGTTLFAYVEQNNIEQYVDYLTYHDDEYSYDLTLHYQALFLPYINGSDKIYYFHFESDGSVRESGFFISFTENSCQCSDSLVSCNNKTHNVMYNSDFICPKLNCSFSMESCQTDYSNLFITASNFADIDSIKVISNNILVYDSATANPILSSDVNVYLKSESNNTMIVNSISRGRKNTTFQLKPFEIPPVDVHAVLTENGFSYVLDVSATRFAVIEIEEALLSKNVSIVIYGHNDEECKTSFYSNENLTEILSFKKCERTNVFYKCYTEKKKMAYYYNKVVNNCFIAFSLSTHQRNCVFNRTVYFVQGEKAYVSVMSTPEGECLATVLKEFGRSYVLSNLFTTAKNSNVEIWFGKNQETKYLEFNKYTSDKWTNITMMSEVYAIKVPKGAILLLTFLSVQLPLHDIVQAPYYSMIATPHYGMKKCFFNDDQAFISFSIGNIGAKFTILGIKSNANVFFQTEGETISKKPANIRYSYFYEIRTNLTLTILFSINKTGDVLTFKNQNVSFHFGKITQEYCGCIFYVEAVEISQLKGLENLNNNNARS